MSSSSAPLPAQPPAPREQSASVPSDRPCDACGYNLRGQTAAWDRQALRWRCTCPECGATQVVRIADDDRAGAANPYVRLIVAGACLWAAWSLLESVAASESALINPVATLQARNMLNRSNGRPAVVLSTTLDALLPFLMQFAAQCIRLVFAAAGLGALVSVAPYGRPLQRTLLAIALLAGACTMGVWMGLVGYSLASGDVASQVMGIVIALNGGGTRPVSSVDEWQWRVVGGVGGLLVAIVAGRIGLAVGRPIARQLASMFLPAESRPTFRDA